MIELAFIVCLRTMPHLCEERFIAYLPEVSLMACMLQAQPELAKWTESHPEFQIQRWSCQHSDDRELKA